jgi:hypothetical protein
MTTYEYMKDYKFMIMCKIHYCRLQKLQLGRSEKRELAVGQTSTNMVYNQPGLWGDGSVD